MRLLQRCAPPALPCALYESFLRRCILPAAKVSRALPDLQMLAHTLQPSLQRIAAAAADSGGARAQAALHA